MSDGKPQWHLQLESDLLGYRELKWGHKILYAYLRFRQGNNPGSWPGLDRIANDLGVVKHTVIRTLRELGELGLISAEKSARTGRGHSNFYTVVPFKVWLEKGAKVAPFQAAEKVQGLHPSTKVKGCKVVHEKGAEVAPEKKREKNNTTPPIVPPQGETVGGCDLLGEPEPQDLPHSKASANGELFNRFWQTYPRKVGRKKCQAIWANLKPTPALAERIVTTVRAYRQTDQWQKDGGRFIPHPATFLNQGRWEDEIPAAPEPKRGDPNWLPTEEQADEIFREAGLIS